MTTIPVGPLLDLVPADGVIGLGEPTHDSANAFAAKTELVPTPAGPRRPDVRYLAAQLREVSSAGRPVRSGP